MEIVFPGLSSQQPLAGHFSLFGIIVLLASRCTMDGASGHNRTEMHDHGLHLWVVLYVWIQIRPPPRKIWNYPKISPVMNSSFRIDPISMLKLCLGPYIHWDMISSIMESLRSVSTPGQPETLVWISKSLDYTKFGKKLKTPEHPWVMGAYVVHGSTTSRRRRVYVGFDFWNNRFWNFRGEQNGVHHFDYAEIRLP